MCACACACVLASPWGKHAGHVFNQRQQNAFLKPITAKSCGTRPHFNFHYWLSGGFTPPPHTEELPRPLSSQTLLSPFPRVFPRPASTGLCFVPGPFWLGGFFFFLPVATLMAGRLQQPRGSVSVELCKEWLGCKMQILSREKPVSTRKPPAKMSPRLCIHFGFGHTQSPLFPVKASLRQLYSALTVTYRGNKAAEKAIRKVISPLLIWQLYRLPLRSWGRHTKTQHFNFCDKRKQLLFFGVAGDNNGDNLARWR